MNKVPLTEPTWDWRLKLLWAMLTPAEKAKTIHDYGLAVAREHPKRAQRVEAR